MMRIFASITYWRWYHATSLILIAALYIRSVGCATLNDTQTLIEDLLQNYNIDVRPTLDQDQAVNVTVLLSIKSIQEIDAVKEMIAFVAGLILTWSDPRMSWTPSMYGGTQKITVSYSKVWVPELVITNPSERVDSLGQRWHRVRYQSNGSAEWVPSNHYKADCPINVHRFPFDTQECPVSFSPIGHTADEVTLALMSNEVKLESFSGNAAWDIVKTESKSSLFAGIASDVTFMIHLKRKSDFFIINILLPVGFLCVLSSFVFLLVPESGERVSFSVTVFLSISIFMTIISDILPKNSEPVPAISYALMLSAALSSTSSIIVILNLRLYHRENQHDVPQWLKKLYMNGMCLQWTKNKVEEMDHEENVTNEAKANPGLFPVKHVDYSKRDEIDPETEGGLPRSAAVPVSSSPVTWRKISTMIDNVSFVIFTLLGLVAFTTFMVRTQFPA